MITNGEYINFSDFSYDDISQIGIHSNEKTETIIVISILTVLIIMCIVLITMFK
jgi:hypothetical protein